MKLHGKTLEGPNEEIIVIPRSSGDIVFKAKAVLEYDAFDKLCPQPVPPTVLKPGGERFLDITDSVYEKALDIWAAKKTHYMFIVSLQATEGLEWDTVKLNDSSTWGNYQTELASSGFSPAEQVQIVRGISAACGLSQERIDEARERFLAGPGVVPAIPSYPGIVPNTTPSGELASDSDSDPQE